MSLGEVYSKNQEKTIDLSSVLQKPLRDSRFIHSNTHFRYATGMTKYIQTLQV